MKALAITIPGIEDIAQLEIKELIKKKSSAHGNILSFEGSEDDLCLLAYKAQSLSHVMSLLTFFDFKDLDDIEKKSANVDLKDWVSKGKSVAVRCERVGIHYFSSQDAEKAVADAILKKLKPKVDLKNPDVIVLVYINDNKCHIGIDFAGFDLSKRDYKIFSHPTSLRGPLAYALVRLSDWDKKESLLDTFSGSGTIPIEAAMWAANLPVGFFKKDKLAFNKLHKFDFEKVDKKINKKVKTKIYAYDGSLQAIYSAQKNAKIATIEKLITFSKMDIEWLDTKFDKGKIDKIATDFPIATDFNIRAMDKTFKEFFHQVEFVLNKEGKIVLLTRNVDLVKKYAEEFKFKLSNERTVAIGQQDAKVLVFER